MSKESYIERNFHDKKNPYVMIDRELIRNANLSPNCRWLLSYLLSNDEGWRINISQLINHLKPHMGKDKVYKIINELISFGYMKRVQKKENGKFVRYAYYVSETPIFQIILPLPENADAEIADPEKADIKKEQGLRNNKDKNKETTTTSSKRKEPSSSFFGENRIKKEALENSKKIIDYCMKIGWLDKISEDLVVDLIVKHGYEYVADQFSYVTQQHMEALKSEKSKDPTVKKKKPIDKPDVYLRIACDKNYFRSNKGRK